MRRWRHFNKGQHWKKFWGMHNSTSQVPPPPFSSQSGWPGMTTKGYLGMWLRSAIWFLDKETKHVLFITFCPVSLFSVLYWLGSMQEAVWANEPTLFTNFMYFIISQLLYFFYLKSSQPGFIQGFQTSLESHFQLITIFYSRGKISDWTDGKSFEEKESTAPWRERCTHSIFCPAQSSIFATIDLVQSF